MNTGDTIWALRKQNARFLPTKVGTGNLERTFVYDERGHATTRMVTLSGGGTVQDLIESYDDETGNMSYRVDWMRDIWDTFDYDGMNRLTDEAAYYQGNSPLGECETFYDGKGNILSRTDAGDYSYGAARPYAVGGLTPAAPSSVPMRDQYLHFNALQLPDTIIENGYTATFSYHGDKSRAMMTVTGPAGYQFSCDYYDQRYNEFSKTVGGVTSLKGVLWLGGTPYSAPAALLKDYGQSGWQVVQVLRDNLGSITHVVDTTGSVLQEMCYTAWGQLRDPQTGTVYGPDNQPELLLGRGYTGHEHLPWFGLVNMNARLYDPAVGRFLSPDPIVQAPDNTQNFNRYSYCLNNPLKYTDPDGKVFWAVPILVGVLVGSVTSGATYAICAGISGSWDSRMFWKSVGLGALTGAISSGLSFAFGAIGNGITSTIGRYGLRFSYSLLNQASSNIVSNLLFNRDFHFSDILAIVGSSALGAALPSYKARSGYSDFKNSACETLYNTGVGGANGLVHGGVRTAFDGDARHIYEDIMGGAVSGFSRTLLTNVLFGSPYEPSHSPGYLGTFRRGGLIMPFLEAFDIKGITIGQNLCITDDYQNSSTEWHEFYHLVQQHNFNGGWADFYSRIIYEYCRYGISNSCNTPGSIKNDARVFESLLNR